jgi:signal peptidase I
VTTSGLVVAVVLAVVLAVGPGAVWARRNLVIISVKGESMEPTYHRGDRVVVRRTGANGLQVGQVIVVAAGKPVGLPTLENPLWMIKRLVAVPGDPVPHDRIPRLRDVPERTVPDGCLIVLGDNPAGTDSRQLGYFFTGNLLGVVIRSLPTRS